jgi:hypothetical protein
MTMTHLLGHVHLWYLYKGRSHHVISCSGSPLPCCFSPTLLMSNLHRWL